MEALLKSKHLSGAVDAGKTDDLQLTIDDWLWRLFNRQSAIVN
jgi:hypothetical protein